MRFIYLILFAFYNVGEERYNWLGVRAVKLNTKNYKDLHAYVVIKTEKCGNFTLLFCRGRHGLVHKCVPHVQHACFSTPEQSIKFLICGVVFLVPVVSLLELSILFIWQRKPVLSANQLGLAGCLTRLKILTMDFGCQLTDSANSILHPIQILWE